MSDAYWVKGPSTAARLRRKYEDQYNPAHFRGVRWVLAAPFLKLWGWTAGKDASQNMTTLMRIGHAVLRTVEWADHDGEEHPESKAAYEAKIADLNKRIEELRGKWRDAAEEARRGRNLARAIRSAGILLDEG